MPENSEKIDLELALAVIEASYPAREWSVRDLAKACTEAGAPISHAGLHYIERTALKKLRKRLYQEIKESIE